jgi:hypothetical protein
MDDFTFCAVVCAGVVAVLAFAGFGLEGAMGLPSALGLFAIALCGYFAIATLESAKVGRASAAISYVLILFLAYFASLLSFGALGVALKYSFIPFAMCAPAVALVAKSSII